MSTMMASLNAYQLRRQVERVITSHGGVIFGGHVRDLVLNDLQAIDYYKFSRFQGVNKYDDVNVLPECNGMRIVSADIDCYMVSHAMDSFVESLNDIHISVHTVFERDDANAYFPLKVPDGVIKHFRFSVTNMDKGNLQYVQELVYESFNESALTLISKNIRSFFKSLRQVSKNCEPLLLDVFVADCANFYTLHPPFGCVDFECNGLLLTHSGLQMSPHLYPELSAVQRSVKLQVVMQDIKNRRAVYVDNNAPAYRVAKMQEKGWYMPMKHITVVDNDPEDQDVCVVCHEDVAGKHFKLTCCSALYHKECMEKVLMSQYSNTCIMCKQATNAIQDVNILIYGS